MWLLTHLRRGSCFIQTSCQSTWFPNANFIVFCGIPQQYTAKRSENIVTYCFAHTKSLVCKCYFIMHIQMSYFVHPQLPSLVLSSLRCLPPHPPLAHVAPLPTLPHPCRRHTDCQTPCRPYRCGRVSEDAGQSRRPSLCWRRQPRLQRLQQ